MAAPAAEDIFGAGGQALLTWIKARCAGRCGMALASCHSSRTDAAAGRESCQAANSRAVLVFSSLTATGRPLWRGCKRKLSALP